MKQFFCYSRLRVFILLGILLVAGPSQGRAEDAPVTVRLDKQQVILGDFSLLTITARREGIVAPSLPSNDDFDIQYQGEEQTGTSHFRLVINGREVQTSQGGNERHFLYRIYPRRVGTLTFGSIDVSLGNGKILRTNPFQMEVVDAAEPSENVFVEITADQQEVYIGQSVVVTFKWYFNQNIQGYEWDVPWLGSLKNFVLRDPQLDKDQEYQRVILNGNQEVLAERKTEVRNGQKYAVIEFQKILVPLAPGSYELDPANLRCEVVTGYEQARRGSGFFNEFFSSDLDTFFGMGKKALTQTLITKSQKIPIHVSEVPEAGKPDHFSKGIGVFDFEVSVSPLEVKVGEPVTVKMEVSGEGNVHQVELPQFPDLESFRSYEPEVRDDEITRDGRTYPRRVFEKVLIPTVSGELDIPELEFPYFDTRQKQYNILRRGPFHLSVKPLKEKEQVQYVALEPQETDHKKEIKIIKQDIQFIKTALGKVQNAHRPFYEDAFYLGVLAGLPPLVMILALGMARRRERFLSDPAFAREKLAYKEAMELLRQAQKDTQKEEKEFYFQLMRALSSYLAAKLRLPMGSVASEVRKPLEARGVSKATADQVHELFEQTDRLKFSSTLAEQDRFTRRELVRRVELTLGKLEKEIK